jgi:hypothetical protein
MAQEHRCHGRVERELGMIPRHVDSLDVIDMVMVIEEVFGTEIPNRDAEGFGNPREIVGRLETNPSNQRPNKQAADFLRRLAKKQQNPELAEGLDGLWRREQISAIIREIIK